MGYSHYWKIEHDINLQAFKELQTVAAKVAEASDAPVGLSINTHPLYPSITVEGMASDAHETFYLTPKAVKFEFCKTARKPYDEVVVGILDYAHRRGLLKFTSDGNPDDLAAGERLSAKVAAHAPRKANKAGDYVINWPEAGAEAAREECLTCDAAITDGGTWGYCVECWEEHGIKVGFGSEDRQGIHTKTYPNGATYRGHYLNDKRHGVGVKTHADGMKVYCVYEHGVLLADPISPMELFLAFGRCTENLNNEASE